MTVSLVKKVKRVLGADEPEPVFVPSPMLLHAFKRARTLKRNVDRASVFNPRLHRRAAQAAMGVRALDAHERRVFQEENA